MAKSKTELHKEAVAVGKVAAGTSPDDFSASDLEALLGGDTVAWKGSLSASKPVVAPDGHENLSKADLDARD